MKKTIIYTILILIVFTLGCKKFLDVNHDVNNPESSTVQLVFPAAVTETASVLGSYGLMLGEIWSQHWTSDANAPQYQAEDSYAVTAGDYNYDIGIWRGIYSGALMDYEWVRNTAMEQENWTYYLMATLMQCYTYQVIADLFEDIPLSDALKGYSPVYDLGSDIYDTLIARIDFAMSKDLKAETCQKPGEDDLIFAGNMDDWIAFGNTLKLKIYLRQAEARPNVASNGIANLYNNSVSFLSKDAKYDVFVDEAGRDNFMYGMEFRYGNINMRASKTLIDFLVYKNDARVDFIYKLPTGSSTHKGLFQGDFRNVYSDTTENPKFSSPRISPTMPFYFFTKAEVLLMQAEVAVRYGFGDAQSLFQSAITADVERLNTTFSDLISSGDLAEINPDNIINIYSFPTSDNEAKIEAIIFQKWICMANIQGLEAFFEHNRTGYPRECSLDITDEGFMTAYNNNEIKGQWIVAVNGVLAPPNRYPKRLLFSSTEQNRNPNTPQVKSLNEKLWWDGSPYSYQ